MPSLRLIFFTLLLANVAFFAWRQNAGPSPGHEPQRLQQQIEPDSLTLIAPTMPAATVVAPPAPTPEENKPTEDRPAETKALEPKAEATVDTKSATKPETKLEAPASKPANTPALLCKAFNGLTPEAAKAAQGALASAAPNTKVTLIPTKESSSYWVHIPPQANKAGAEKKVSELKQLGVEDSFIISDDGPNKWAVSLGLFKSKDMAEAYLQKLNKQGVRSAKIDVRDKGNEKVRLEVTAPAETLGVLAREIKPLAAATLSDCKPAEATKSDSTKD